MCKNDCKPNFACTKKTITYLYIDIHRTTGHRKICRLSCVNIDFRLQICEEKRKNKFIIIADIYF